MSKMSGLHRKEQARLFCQGHAGKKRFYRKILEKWEEKNVGTCNAEFIITIKKGFSFVEGECQRKKSFPTVHAAMSGIHEIYTCPVVVEKKSTMNTDDTIEKNDKEKQAELIEVFGTK